MNLELAPALEHLANADPVMAGLIRDYPLELKEREVNLLEDLTSAIISQQLSTKAADTIYKRFLALFDGKFPEPGQLLAMPEDSLRATGISRPKIRYLKGIAAAVLAGELDLAQIPTLGDDEAIVELTKLKGIGPWTAEMILMFSLYRPDVFSLGDLGLRNAVSRHYGVDRVDLPAIKAIAEKWRPYRTTACRLLWASLDNAPKG